MAQLEANKWRVVEDIELWLLWKLQVAKLVPLPSYARLLPSKWVYKIKRSGIFKAHFVTKGDH